MKLGIDIANTIIMRNGIDSSLGNISDNAFPFAFESIAYLVDLFDKEVFLVSACTQEGQENNLEWLKHHDFFRQTGLLESNLRFCRQRNLKAAICEEVRITHFIDDRIKVLRSLSTVPHKYCFAPSINPERDYSGMHILSSWSEIPSVFPRT